MALAYLVEIYKTPSFKFSGTFSTNSNASSLCLKFCFIRYQVRCFYDFLAGQQITIDRICTVVLIFKIVIKAEQFLPFNNCLGGIECIEFRNLDILVINSLGIIVGKIDSLLHMPPVLRCAGSGS